MATPYSRTKVQAVTGTAANIVLSGKATQIILSSTTDCWINFNGTAVVNGCFYLPADTPITVDLSMDDEISVIQDSAGGYLSVMEMANSVLFTRVRGWFTSNAVLKSTDITTSYTGDANLKLAVASTATGDSNLVGTVEDTATGDSSLLKTVSDTVTGDADLVTP